MRFFVLLAVAFLAACAGEKLTQAPPPGVDFSGRWKLNDADSDDPQRLLQAQFDKPVSQTSAPSGGGGGRGGGRQGGGGMGSMGGLQGPQMPSIGALDEGLRWPGKQLEIKQVAGVVAFSSDGIDRVCQPTDGGKFHRLPHGDPGGRDPPSRGREAAPPRCGWTEKTLIVQGGDPDDDRPPFEEQYSLSEDRQRLIEVVVFKGGRSSGYTMSRVWDRLPQ
jgi:hypothetical protein